MKKLLQKQKYTNMQNPSQWNKKINLKKSLTILFLAHHLPVTLSGSLWGLSHALAASENRMSSADILIRSVAILITGRVMVFHRYLKINSFHQCMLKSNIFVVLHFHG